MTSSSYRSRWATPAIVSYSAHIRTIPCCSAQSAAIVSVADWSAPRASSTCRSTSPASRSAGRPCWVSASGSYIVSTYSLFDSRPRVAATYSTSRWVVTDTKACAVSTVRPWARCAVVAYPSSTCWRT